MIAKTYHVEVPEIGRFAFRRRTMGDECRILAMADRLIGDDGVAHSERAWNLAYLLAALSVLTEQAPDGWDPINADPGDRASYDRIMTVWSAMQDADARFRNGAGAGSPSPSEDAGAVG